MPESVLAIDPGRNKCGVAIVTSDNVVLFRSVIPTESISVEIARLIRSYNTINIVVGNGTGSKGIVEVVEHLQHQIPGIHTNLVDESFTSELARKRFLAEIPTRGLQKLLPKSLRTPQSPYDDFVAVILAERFWKQESQQTTMPSQQSAEQHDS